MPISGSSPSKVYTRQIGAYTGADAWAQLDAAAIPIRSEDQDTQANDFGSAINACLFKDGGNFATDMDINANKFLDVGDAAARNQFASAGQIADGELTYAGTSSGTDTVTATLTPAITAYVTGMLLAFKAGGTNTGATTLNVNSVDATTVRKGPDAATALGAGDITTGGMYLVQYTGSVWHLLNPGLGSNVSAFMATVLDDASASDARTTLGLGTIATQAANNVAITGGSISGITDLAVADGGTGASTAAGARTNLGAILTDAVFPGALLVIVEDQQSSGTAPQSLPQNATTVRRLNTLVYNRNTVASLSSNRVTLPAGTYEIAWWAGAGGGENVHQSQLYNQTDAAVVGLGNSARCDGGSGIQAAPNDSAGRAVVTIAGSKAFEIRHVVGNIDDILGGDATSLGTEIYTRVEIRAA